MKYVKLDATWQDLLGIGMVRRDPVELTPSLKAAWNSLAVSWTFLVVLLLFI